MSDAGVLYREEREQIIELVEVLDDAGVATPVPTCPEWTVREVIAHLAGVCDDVINGNIAGVGSDEWTAAQVAKRAGASMADLLQEWKELGPQIDDIAPQLPGWAGAQLITDTTTHEHDVRMALGAAGNRDSEAVLMGAEMLVLVGLDASVRHHGLAPLAVEVPERRWVVGLPAPEGAEPEAPSGADALLQRIVSTPVGHGVSDAEAATTLTAPAFEVFRALTGRRSLDQVRDLDWHGDPEPYLPAFRFGSFSPSPHPIAE